MPIAKYVSIFTYIASESCNNAKIVLFAKWQWVYIYAMAIAFKLECINICAYHMTKYVEQLLINVHKWYEN